MAAVALLKFTQGFTVGADGQALKGVLGTPVNVQNSSNTSVVSWQIDLVYVDPSSAISPATPYAFNNNSSTPFATFTPDVRGSYRFVLKVWEVPNRVGMPTNVDIRIFNVPEINGLVVPPSQLWPRPLPVPQSGEPGNKPPELNFGGQPDGWAGDGSSDGLVNETIRRVDQFGVGVTAVQEVLEVTSDGQTAFTLSQPTTSNTTVAMYVNGVKQAYGNDYEVDEAALTYTGTIDLQTTDQVEVWYVVGKILGSNSVRQETIAVDTNGQTSFTLTQPTTSNSTVAMFLNSGKMQYGVDYTVLGAEVTYTGSITLQTTDVVEFYYLIGPIVSLSGSVPPLSNVFYVDGGTLATDRDGSISKPYSSITEAITQHPAVGDFHILKLLVTPGTYTGNLTMSADEYSHLIISSTVPCLDPFMPRVVIEGDITLTGVGSGGFLDLQDVQVETGFTVNATVINLNRSTILDPAVAGAIRLLDNYSSITDPVDETTVEARELWHVDSHTGEVTTFNPFPANLQFIGLYNVCVYIEIQGFASAGTMALIVNWFDNTGAKSKTAITGFDITISGAGYATASFPVRNFTNFTYDIDFTGVTGSPNIHVSFGVHSLAPQLP